MRLLRRGYQFGLQSVPVLLSDPVYRDCCDAVQLPEREAAQQAERLAQGQYDKVLDRHRCCILADSSDPVLQLSVLCRSV